LINSLTGEDTPTAIGVSDGAVVVDAVLCGLQTIIANAVLTITQLAKCTGGTAGRAERETAGIPAANEGVRTRSEGSEGNEVLHDCCSANLNRLIS
jgi:hypothetical protein